MDSTSLIVLAVVLGLLVLASLCGLIAMAIGREFGAGFFGFFREVFWVVGVFVSAVLKGCASAAVLLLVITVWVGFLITRL